jgi:hypothetical protein
MKTTDSFRFMSAGSALPDTAVEGLHRDGFAVVPGPASDQELQKLIDTYDRAVLEADPRDTRHGSTTTRVDDFVNRDPEFDCVYVHRPLLEASWRVFMRPFKLCAMLARTLRPGSLAQTLHQDFPRDEAGWTMVGFTPSKILLPGGRSRLVQQGLSVKPRAGEFSRQPSICEPESGD